MKDPHPGNIVGEKTVSHVVEHSVRWDYIALAAAGLFLAWKLGQAFGNATESAEGLEIAEVADGEKNQGTGLGMEV